MKNMQQKIPTNIRGKYAKCLPNEDISLNKEVIRIEIPDGENKTRALETEGEIYLALLPFPQINCKFELDPWAALEVSPASTPAQIKLQVGNHSSASWQVLKTSGGNVTAMPEPQTLKTGDVNTEVSSVIFHILNFCNYVGERVQYEQLGNERRHRLVLPSDDWTVTIDAVEDVEPNIEEVKGTRGYAITHVGRLELTNGDNFRYEDAQKALSTLGYLLSFTRGLWCFPILLLGQDKNGEEVWQEWGLQLTSPWRYASSWFDRNHAAKMLPSLSNKFFEKVNNRTWKQIFEKVIYWYIQSNTFSGLDGSIILSQTALEALSWNLLVNDRRAMDEGAFKKTNAANQIRLLLSFCQIPLNVPANCTALNKLSQEYNLNDGPAVITFVRNKIVHPSKTTIPSEVYNEARNLMLHYVELALLSILGYSEVYSNRLTAQWEGEVENVPWI